MIVLGPSDRVFLRVDAQGSALRIVDEQDLAKEFTPEAISRLNYFGRHVESGVEWIDAQRAADCFRSIGQ